MSIGSGSLSSASKGRVSWGEVDLRHAQAGFDQRVPGGWLELDPETVRAETPAQFRLMLSRIAKVAGLTAGQVAVKANIPRSQAYALAKESPVLPRKPAQVKAFLQACNVSPAQVDDVMRVWRELSERDGETASSAEVDGLQEGEGLGGGMPGTQIRGDITLHSGNLEFGAATNIDGDIHVHHFAATREVVMLARFVLNDERRTNRALRLLGRLAVVLSVLLGFVAYVLTLIPAAVVTQLVLGATAVLGVVVSVAGVWSAVRRTRRRRAAIAGPLSTPDR